MSIIKYVTLQKIVAHDFWYDPRIILGVTVQKLMARMTWPPWTCSPLYQGVNKWECSRVSWLMVEKNWQGKKKIGHAVVT